MCALQSEGKRLKFFLDELKKFAVFVNQQLSDDDMKLLGSMPQCNGTRGNWFPVDDPEYGPDYDNTIGPMPHC